MAIPVSSTYGILKNKVLNCDIDKTWAHWALEMMQAGFESSNLYILAGISEPYNQFELHALTTNVLNDLNLDFSDKQQVLRNYAYSIINQSINKPDCYVRALQELKSLCCSLNMDKEYMDFYLLYFAKDDLSESEVQWYWEGANRGNIDSIITRLFQNWSDNYEKKYIQTGKL
jgi:hypothetical protein